jgi:hypothetical protein
MNGIALPTRLEPLARDRPQSPALIAPDDQRTVIVKQRRHPPATLAARSRKSAMLDDAGHAHGAPTTSGDQPSNSSISTTI